MKLDILTHGRKLRCYPLNGIDTVGVFGDEPFAIKFSNSSHQKVQVKISLDGTDVLTGKVADLSPNSKIWVVNGYGSMELKAWPESAQGGAAFVFTSVEQSVAAHTHGDMAAKGFISCAIWIEGYTPPSMATIADCTPRVLPVSPGGPRDLGGGPAIGAGNYQEQRIQAATGLIEPQFLKIIQIRYLWWDDLVARLQETGISTSPQYPTGFHGIDLGDTPRIGESHPVSYSRHEL